MTHLNSIEYYTAREKRERALAEAAIDPAIAAIHLQMAERYAELTAKLSRETPMLMVRSHK